MKSASAINRVMVVCDGNRHMIMPLGIANSKTHDGFIQKWHGFGFETIFHEIRADIKNDLIFARFHLFGRQKFGHAAIGVGGRSANQGALFTVRAIEFDDNSTAQRAARGIENVCRKSSFFGATIGELRFTATTLFFPARCRGKTNPDSLSNPTAF